jgi:hypothetical protein
VLLAHTLLQPKDQYLLGFVHHHRLGLWRSKMRVHICLYK